jgi:hypothetical protein
MSLAPDRDKYRNASDAPAMLGISPYTTRQELLDRIKYGVQKNITPAVQDIFDAGHRIEALARPIAETLLGHPLQPKRFTNGNLGATLDGYYLDAATLDSINWECKTLNDAIRAAFEAVGYAGGIAGAISLPEYLRAQIEQQLMCSEADKCLFTAYADGEAVHCWYYPEQSMRQRIIDGWTQFERDLAAMPDVMPVKAIEGQLMPVVREFPFMPVVGFGIVRGSLQDVQRFENEGREFVKTINQNLVTDQDFADGESDKKNLAKAVELLDALLDSPQDMAALKRVRELFNKARISLEKQLVERKQARNFELVYATLKAYEAYVLALDLAPHISYSVDFKQVIKGLSSIASMQNALSAALLKAQSEATAQAVKIRANLALIAAAGNDLLFTDKPTLVHRLPEDVQNAIKVRLAEHAAKVAADAEKARLVEQVFDPGAESPAVERVLIGSPRPESMRTLNIGQINERLSVVSVTRAQLIGIGFAGVEGKIKGRFEWLGSDYPGIVAAIKSKLDKG